MALRFAACITCGCITRTLERAATRRSLLLCPLSRLLLSMFFFSSPRFTYLLLLAHRTHLTYRTGPTNTKLELRIAVVSMPCARRER